MTRKDYNRAVVVLQETYPDPKKRKEAAIAFAVFFKSDNDRFDQTRFMLALDSPVKT